MKTKKFNIKFLTLMIVIIIIIYITQLGYIQLLPKIYITLVTIPIALGAIVVGHIGGFICGIVSNIVWGILSGFNLSAIAMLARPLTGLFTGLIFKVLYNNKKIKKSSYYIAAFCCPVLNTLLFKLVIIFYNVEYIHSMAEKFKNPFLFIINFIGISELINIIICFIIISVILRALHYTLENQEHIRLIEKIPLEYKICANCHEYAFGKSKKDFYDDEAVSRACMIYMFGKRIVKADNDLQNCWGYCTYRDININANKVCDKFEPPLNLIEKYNK